jgi:hypothetical protein
MVRSAYREFETQITMAASVRPAKGDLIRRTVLDQVHEFTLAGILAQLPSVSPQLIKKVLSGMKDDGSVRLVGRGRGASWRVTP